LRLSEEVASRLDIPRWHTEPSNPRSRIFIAPATRIDERARAITFTHDDLQQIGVSRNDLAPFIFDMGDRGSLLAESTGHSSLERQPLVAFETDLLLALPTAVSPAIRRLVLSELRVHGLLEKFSDALSALQSRQVEVDGFFEIKSQTASLRPPSARARRSRKVNFEVL
jgi:hypothetical protein